MRLGTLQYRPVKCAHGRQAGYMLIVLIFLMAGLTLAALAMAPAIAQQIKRDREQEMVHRGAQYARAIQKYYKKFGRYPPTLEALEDTNHIRFLRKRYKDPMTRDGKWQVVRFGQVQFDAANRQGGTGFSGQSGLPNVPGVTGLLTGSQPSSSPMQPLGSTNAPGGTTGLLSGQNQPGSTQQSGASNTPGKTDTTDSNSSSFGLSTTGGGNQPLGGGAIIGVASMSKDQSLRVVDDKNHYNEWKFIYDPTFDRGGLINGPYDPKKQVGKFPGGQQLGQPIGQPIGQQPSSGFGDSPSGNSQQQKPIPEPYQPPDTAAPPSNPQ